MKSGIPRRCWTQEELALLTKLYPDRPTAEIATKLGRGIFGVYGMANKMELHKSKEFLQGPESGMLRKGQTRPEGIPHQFGKGHVPANKGLRRPGYRSGRMQETQFKKGNRTGVAAKNWRPIGTIAADSEGYFRIKVREAERGEHTGFGNTKVWPLLNRVLWEHHKSPIPPKHIVAFKDRNRANVDIENLECISMKENASRNRMWNIYPRQLAEAIQINGVLKRKLRSMNG